MKNMKLILLLILTAGCVNPVEYYDNPINIKDETIFTEEIVQFAKQVDDLCLGDPLGTFSCASMTTAMWSTPIKNIDHE